MTGRLRDRLCCKYTNCTHHAQGFATGQEEDDKENLKVADRWGAFKALGEQFGFYESPGVLTVVVEYCTMT